MLDLDGFTCVGYLYGARLGDFGRGAAINGGYAPEALLTTCESRTYSDDEAKQLVSEANAAAWARAQREEGTAMPRIAPQDIRPHGHGWVYGGGASRITLEHGVLRVWEHEDEIPGTSSADLRLDAASEV